jgi:hypothetical protein
VLIAGILCLLLGSTVLTRRDIAKARAALIAIDILAAIALLEIIISVIGDPPRMLTTGPPIRRVESMISTGSYSTGVGVYLALVGIVVLGATSTYALGSLSRGHPGT